MENNTQLEIVKTQILVSVPALNYQKRLQEAEAITFTKDTINQDYAPLKSLREAVSLIDKTENPHTAAWSNWNAAKKSLVDPLKEVLNRKTKEYEKMVNEVKKEQFQQQQEKLRVDGINNKITIKKIEFANKIASAESANEIVSIQKLMGSEKAKKGEYQEFLPNLAANLDELTPLIEDKKKTLKTITKLESEVFENEEQLEMGQEATARLLQTVHEANQQIQHKAIDSATIAPNTIVGESVVALPKARRTTWAYEVTDIQELRKSNPNFVKVVPDTEAIEAYIKKQKDEKTIREYHHGGLRIYKKESY